MASLQAAVDSALGYPVYGVDAATGQPILPAQGQDPATVHGVTLHYSGVIVNPGNAQLAAYEYDPTNSAAVAVWVAANPGKAADVADLDATWFPDVHA